MKKIKMKKTVSTVLIAAMLATGAGSAFAWVPSDTDDPKCIDIRKLNERRIIEYPVKEGKKICGCKTCEVAAMTFDKLEEYISKLEKEMSELDEDIRTNYKKWATQKLQDLRKVDNRDSILRSMQNNIKAKNYVGRNYSFVSTNYGVGESGVLGFFAKQEGINYGTEYGDDYFDELNNRIENILKAREGECDEDRKVVHDMLPKLYDREFNLAVFSVLVLLPAISTLIGAGIAYVSGKIEQAKAKKKIDTKSDAELNEAQKLSETKSTDKKGEDESIASLGTLVK